MSTEGEGANVPPAAPPAAGDEATATTKSTSKLMRVPLHHHRILGHSAVQGVPGAPYQVPMTLYKANREKLRQRLLAKGASSKALVLMEGGKEEYRHESDTEKLFRQESSFMYLFGVKEPSFYATMEVATGITTLYMPRLPAEYAVWMGKIQPPEHFQQHYKVDKVFFVDELASTLQAFGPEVLYVNKGLNTDSGNYAKPADFDGMEATFKAVLDYETLYPELVECRVIKSKEEIKLLQYVNDVSSDAHLAVMRRVQPGQAEYQLESDFLHHCYYHGGCRHVAYTSICACGPNNAVLHYGHAAAPNDRTITQGDMLLLDMGCEYACYGSDITCSFPASGKFSEDQRFVFETVQAMQFAVMDALKPGVAWKDMHALAYRVGCEKLLAFGLLQGATVDKLMDLNIMSFFMPHGLGHFMGLDVHDCGGYPVGSGLERDTRPGYKSLRTVRKMETGMVITVEPGIYFIDVLLDQLLADTTLNRYVNKEVLARFRGSGGVRLEDDVVITEDCILNLTHCPRTVEDVEAVMAGKITQKGQLFKKY